MTLDWQPNRHRMEAEGSLGTWRYRSDIGEMTFLPKTERHWSVIWVKMEDGPEKDLFAARHRETALGSCHPLLIQHLIEAFEAPNPDVNTKQADPAEILLTKLKFDFNVSGGKARQYSIKAGPHHVSVMLTDHHVAVRIDKRGSWTNMLWIMNAQESYVSDDIIPLYWPENIINPVAIACQFIVDVMIDAIAAEPKWKEPKR